MDFSALSYSIPPRANEMQNTLDTKERGLATLKTKYGIPIAGCLSFSSSHRFGDLGSGKMKEWENKTREYVHPLTVCVLSLTSE